MSFLKGEREGQRDRKMGRAQPKTLVFRKTKGATSQERWALSRNWKRQGNGLSSRGLKRNSVLLTP